LDAGIGLFDGDMSHIAVWIKELVQIIYKGIEKG